MQAAQPEHQPLKEVARTKIDGGYVAKTYTSSSSSISMSPQEMAKKLPRHEDGTKVAIDWHGTFETKVNGRDAVPSSHVREGPVGLAGSRLSHCPFVILWQKEGGRGEGKSFQSPLQISRSNVHQKPHWLGRKGGAVQSRRHQYNSR